ncbi:MAG: hypothetical protein ACI8UD_003683 [Planctomycetota bacterium]|jgi:hypothetical protein
MPECHPSVRFAPQTSEHVVVDGRFSSSEVQDLVLALLDGQINQHKLLSLGNSVHTHEPLGSSKRSIQELSEARTEILKILAVARANGQTVRARSTIELVIESDAAPTTTKPTMPQLQLQDVV